MTQTPPALSKAVTSKVLKAALYHYFRFERGWLCADEAAICYGRCDMVVDTGKDILEIEVKISKSDLWGGEAKKIKHKKFFLSANAPTKFYICVPTELVDEAVKWVAETNEKYGIIVFDSWRYGRGLGVASTVIVKRSAQKLHKLYKSRKDKISMRLCSIIASIRIKGCEA